MDNLKERAHSLLRKSESFFKTDMVYIAKGGSWLGAGQVASAAIAFVSSLFFANIVSKDLYGSYKFVIASTSILASLSLTGMGSIVTQGVAQGAEGVLDSAVRTTLRWGWIIISAGLAVSGYYFFNHNYVLGFAMLLAGASLPISQAFTLYGNYLMGKKDFKKVVIYGNASQLVTTAILIATAVLTGSIIAMVAAYFITNTAATYIAYRRTLSSFHINKIHDHSLIPYGKHLSLMGALGTVASQFDKLLVFHYLGAAQLAVYAFSQAIPDQLKGVLKSIFGIALPKYAALSDSGLRESISKKFVQLTLLTTGAVIVFILCAPIIFKLLFPKYMEAVIYSQIYMLGLITIPGISLFSTYFQLKKATRPLYELNIVGNIMTLLITFVLIYKYGVLGAAIANGSSWMFMLLMHWYYFAREGRRASLTAV